VSARYIRYVLLLRACIQVFVWALFSSIFVLFSIPKGGPNRGLVALLLCM
jgi:hypothetical protein